MQFLLISLLLLITANLPAQQGINYKAIIHNSDGDALENTAISVQFTILQNGTTSVYQETHSPTTDANGIIIVNIGEGTVVSGDYSTIDWGGNPHYLKTEIDIGEGLTDMGTTEFKTVPYALHSETATVVTDYLDFEGVEAGDALIYDGNVFKPANYSFYYKDGDGDGHGIADVFIYSPIEPPSFVNNSGDCDDNNAAIYPGAIELCDGIDNDCDLQVDEGSVCAECTPGTIETRECYGGPPSTLGVGVCSGGTQSRTCTASEVWGAWGACEGAVYPVQEICDGLDNDCDGAIDEDVGSIWYIDADSDLYGDINVSILACEQPNGFVEDPGDCDDNNNMVNPDAVEVLDQIDNDCDGEVDEGLVTDQKIIITEFMVNPENTGNPSGEWIELFNIGSQEVFLDNMVIRDDDFDYHLIERPLYIPSEGTLVLCAEGDFTVNGGVSCDYVYRGLSLANTVDEIIVELDGIEIIRIEYDLSTWPSAPGRSISLDPVYFDPINYQNAVNWCDTPIDQSYQMPGGDYGTPTVVNPSCVGN